jgi:hypothetical protein
MSDFTTIDRDDFRNLLEEIGKTRMPFGKFDRRWDGGNRKKSKSRKEIAFFFASE